MKSLARILLFSVAVAGCQTNPMRTPVIYSREGVDPYDRQTKTQRTNEYEIFFATDCAPTKEERLDERYAAKRGESLRLGSAVIRFGKEESGWSELHERTLAGKPLDPELASIEDYGPLWTTMDDDDRADLGWTKLHEISRRFVRDFDGRLEATRKKDVLIYVHGYNTNYPITFGQTAQLAHYLAGDSLVIGFTWPTKGSVFGYIGDKVESYRSVRNLRELIRYLAKETQVEKIHLFSYSAGAPIVTQALLQLRLIQAEKPIQEVRANSKIGTVVYAAPDQDLEAFKIALVDRVFDLAEVITVYTSSQDNSFGLGQTFVYRDSRLGRPEEGITEKEREGLRHQHRSGFIDVSNAEDQAGKSSLGHMYWYQNPWVISDLVMGLRFSLTPAERGLVRGEGEWIWGFPDDYRARALDAARKVIAKDEKE